MSHTGLVLRPAQAVETWLCVDWLSFRVGAMADRPVGRMHFRVEVQSGCFGFRWLPPRRKTMRPVRDAADLHAALRQIRQLRRELEEQA